ncbi:deoxyribose-phosphate aldolase [Desulforamulus ferrireducens]|uniref:Deoxyribose-phosphate aldolase n=1 Tax=Desulforamulus ferrireducens TaxID=1833852 RepID=A0A1S6IVG2_9FIRM|nr:deoxyribose-phosphate aldolase [Desulforamulus ferrireducens]AQS58760.1 deoxyribose-phosphate aldolase [Desulforamulus ferrireducens]
MNATRTEIAKTIDHTLLKAVATGQDIIKLCQEAKEYGFASVCVNPTFVSLAAEQLKDSGIMVCTVVGFPLGCTTTATKVEETREAVNNGAQEIDMVINLGALKEGNDDLVCQDIAAVVKAAQEANPSTAVKVIIETCYLTHEEKILACQLAKTAGAHFVKTSTGFGTGGATIEDVALMREVVGPAMGVKASGGIKTSADVLALLKAGANRIGASAGVKIMKELS